MKIMRFVLSGSVVALASMVSDPVGAQETKTTAIVKSISNVKNVGSVTNDIGAGDGPITTTTTIGEFSPRTVNNSRSNIKNNSPVNVTGGDGPVTTTSTVNNSTTDNGGEVVGGWDVTTNKKVMPVHIESRSNAGPATTTATITDSSTTVVSPSKNNNSTGDVGVLSNTQLSSTVSGNTITLAQSDTRNPTLPPVVRGNSIGSNAFTGATGVTVNNMNSGASSNVQSTLSIVVPSSGAVR